MHKPPASLYKTICYLVVGEEALQYEFREENAGARGEG